MKKYFCVEYQGSRPLAYRHLGPLWLSSTCHRSRRRAQRTAQAIARRGYKKIVEVAR